MRRDAAARHFCFDDGMRKVASWILVGMTLTASGPAVAYSGRWLVVEDINTQTCYRMTEMPEGTHWRQVGDFNTFRQAGMWIWEHRGGICQSSPVFG
jgi:hypothetical protein